ncbi:MAG: prolipoprotein diacylglyceryl transferase [Candidatus Omnitrophica bacterium]|nr:prolipoprotein diacylglyceryl transferase [Candidatus Omnitrophota bacterium]
MHPVICQFGPVTVYSYGLMLAVAALVCGFLAAREARPTGIPSEVIYDLVFWLVISGVVGARLFFIFLNFSFFLENPVEIVMIQKGGLAWHGGLVAAGLTGIWFVRKKKLPLTRMLDLTAPYIALGEAIGRIGCFLNGCCYGRETPWGVYFPVHHARLHPTQLYSFAGLLVLFFVLKWYRRISSVPGDVFAAYLFGAAMLRFVVEFFRADHDILAGGLSVYQWICLVLMPLAVYVHYHFKSRAGTSS